MRFAIAIGSALALLAAASVVSARSLSSQAVYARSHAVLRAFQHDHPCPSTNRTTGPCPGWVKDHIVALCAGGADAVTNLQWQTVAQARAKDRTECPRRPPRRHDVAPPGR